MQDIYQPYISKRSIATFKVWLHKNMYYRVFLFAMLYHDTFIAKEKTRGIYE